MYTCFVVCCSLLLWFVCCSSVVTCSAFVFEFVSVDNGCLFVTVAFIVMCLLSLSN